MTMMVVTVMKLLMMVVTLVAVIHVQTVNMIGLTMDPNAVIPQLMSMV